MSIEKNLEMELERLIAPTKHSYLLFLLRKRRHLTLNVYRLLLSVSV